MYNRRLILSVFAALVVLMIGGIIYYFATRTHLTPAQQQYYANKNIIHTDPNQKPDSTAQGNTGSIVLLNTDRLYNTLTDGQFQQAKNVIAYYIHTDISQNIGTAEVQNGYVTTNPNNSDVSFYILTTNPVKSLKVLVHPVDYNSALIFINGQLITPQYFGQGDT